MFDPHSISQDELHKLRKAAEAAWGDDTRHMNYAEHPQPAAGQCYVTSRWLVDKLGGYVGLKNGHFFWVSPDKQYVIDLTGDQYGHAPEDMRFHGMKLDDEDEGWIPAEHQRQWRPGPILYKLATHPIYKDFRIKSVEKENERTKLFIKRANAEYQAL